MLLTAAFETPLTYINYSLLISVLERLIAETKDDLLQTTLVRDLYPPILRSLKRQSLPQAEKLFLAILGGIPKLSPKSDINTRKTVSKLYGAAIHQK